MPDMADSDITDPLIDEHYFPIIPIAQGLIIGTANNDAAVTSLLNTSESAFSKADGYNITTYEKEDDDTDDIYFTNNKSMTAMRYWLSTPQRLRATSPPSAP